MFRRRVVTTGHWTQAHLPLQDLLKSIPITSIWLRPLCPTLAAEFFLQRGWDGTIPGARCGEYYLGLAPHLKAWSSCWYAQAQVKTAGEPEDDAGYCEISFLTHRMDENTPLLSNTHLHSRP